MSAVSEMVSAATLSPCGAYRYRLTRIWDDSLPALVFCMLNPSTADASIDDATIRRCMAFAHAFGFGGIVVVNLYALRATKPTALAVAADPVGPENDAAWRDALSGAEGVIAAWGAQKGIGGQVARFRRLCAEMGVPLWSLGTTKDGHPRHPLYLPKCAERSLWAD